MAYILDSQEIRRPHEISEKNNTQVAIQRTLSGAINRDYFGANKRVWVLSYRTVQPGAYATIKAIYDSYLSNAVAKTFSITETNYTVSQTNVHVDLVERGFSIYGSDYLSDFQLTLTEA